MESARQEFDEASGIDDLAQRDEATGYSSDDIKTAQDIVSSGRPRLRGAEAFKLYDTFGLPLDFMQDAVRDAGFDRFDQSGFDAAMEEQRKRAQASWKGSGKATASPVYSLCRKPYSKATHKPAPTTAKS